MSVDSYLELFTSPLRLDLHGILWDVLVSTGIAYLPFLGILIDNWREPAQGWGSGPCQRPVTGRMEIELFIALLVVVLAGQPAALTPSTPQPCRIRHHRPGGSSTGRRNRGCATEYLWHDRIYWLRRNRQCPGMVVRRHRAEFGLNHAIVEGLPTVADMRTFEQQAHLATIADPRLRQEVSDFFSQCYIPARSKYQAERPDTPAISGITCHLWRR